MAIDDRVKKLLASGSLTGKEAGKLMMRDSWLVDRGKDGFLRERDIQALKASLKTQQDIEDYNSYIHTYRLIDYTLKEAHILALTIQRDLTYSARILGDYLLEGSLQRIQLWGLPAIVTQKQYAELSSKQRANKLQEIITLKEVLEQRALLLAEPELESEWLAGDEEGFFYEYYIYHLQESYPDMWKDVLSQVLEILQEGKFQPVQVAKDGQAKLEKLWQKIRDGDKDKDIQTQIIQAKQHDSAYATNLDKLRKQEEQLLQELYKDGHRHRVQAELISQLEALRDGSLSEDEEYKLLELTLCSVEDLYQAGLPEWVEHVDKYIPNWDEETAARPLDMMQSTRVAIIQNPEPDDLDERGYYKDKNPLAELTVLRLGKKGSSKSKEKGDYLQEIEKPTIDRLKAFLAMLTVLEAVSEVTGIDFTEDMREWHEMSELSIKLYNGILEDIPAHLERPELKPIKLESLKPSKATVKYIQERMAMGLGQGWQDSFKAMAEELLAKEAEHA